MQPNPFRVGDWLVEPQLNRISQGDHAVPLEPRAMEVLAFLAGRPGEVVSTDQLIEAVWNRRFVGDSPVYRIIAELRRVLGDDARQPRYIQTIRKRGYRLVAEVASEPGARITATPRPTPNRECAALEALSPDFETLRTLAVSELARVFLARENSLKRLVAIKVLRRRAAGDATARQRFLREAQAAARVTHPAVAAVYRVGSVADDLPYMVMEYVEGRSAADALAADGPFDDTRCRRLMTDVAAGLEAAHGARVIHRNVKPSNILMREEGSFVLTDFGIAAFRETGGELATKLTREGEFVGDLRYTSPEQLLGGAPGPHADIYSLGVVAYEVLTRQWPFEADSEDAMLTAALRHDPRPVSASRDDLTRDLCDLVQRCLVKSPGQRPSAGQIVKELQQPAPEETSTRASQQPGLLTRLRDAFSRRRR